MTDAKDLLSRFSLPLRGDRNERRLWPYLSSHFPSYELLWRKLIVPLTRRTDSTTALTDQNWIRLQVGISTSRERLAMPAASNGEFVADAGVGGG